MLDLNVLLVKRPAATFFVRVQRESMAAFDVSICWVTETNDTLCCSKSFERSVKSQGEA